MTPQLGLTVTAGALWLLALLFLHIALDDSLPGAPRLLALMPVAPIALLANALVISLWPEIARCL